MGATWHTGMHGPPGINTERSHLRTRICQLSETYIFNYIDSQHSIAEVPLHEGRLCALYTPAPRV